MARPKRSSRRILGGFRDPMATNDERDPNYHYRFFNDDPNKPGRIQEAIEAGYEVVEGKAQIGDPAVDNPKKLGSAMTRPVGNGVTGVLMRKPLDWHLEDQAEKQKTRNETEAAIRRKANQPGFYGKIDIGRDK